MTAFHDVHVIFPRSLTTNLRPSSPSSLNTHTPHELEHGHEQLQFQSCRKWFGVQWFSAIDYAISTARMKRMCASQFPMALKIAHEIAADSHSLGTYSVEILLGRLRHMPCIANPHLIIDMSGEHITTGKWLAENKKSEILPLNGNHSEKPYNICWLLVCWHSIVLRLWHVRHMHAPEESFMKYLVHFIGDWIELSLCWHTVAATATSV